MRRLTRAFFDRDSLSVARDLIGCVLVSRLPQGTAAVRLVEVEAYRGSLDPGSHGYRGVTPRTVVMYGPPGRLYVYFSYGMHWCANVVCAPPGQCEAVLLRAGEPVAGIDLMRARRKVDKESLLASGPGRLAQALGIQREHNGATLLRGGSFFLAEDGCTFSYRRGEIAVSERVGLARGKGDDLPWRFFVAGNPNVSGKRRTPGMRSRGGPRPQPAQGS
jgi:DNA-3-methyladenine glycosylase